MRKGLRSVLSLASILRRYDHVMAATVLGRRKEDRAVVLQKPKHRRRRRGGRRNHVKTLVWTAPLDSLKMSVKTLQPLQSKVPEPVWVAPVTDPEPAPKAKISKCDSRQAAFRKDGWTVQVSRGLRGLINSPNLSPSETRRLLDALTDMGESDAEGAEIDELTYMDES